MTSALVAQLERFGPLPAEERLALASAGATTRRVASGVEIAPEDAESGVVRVLLSGFACRYVTRPDGGRQILAYLLPGDLYHPAPPEAGLRDHTVATLTSASLAYISRATLETLCERLPRIARALRLFRGVEEATLHQWMLSLGYRSALQGTAHLLCELVCRLRAVGLADERFCMLPLRQTDLAEALALSAVHLNRALAELRRRKLATFARRELHITDFAALAQLCGFRSDYLFGGQRFLLDTPDAAASLAVRSAAAGISVASSNSVSLTAR